MLGKLKSLIALDLYNILKDKSIETLKKYIPSLLYVNKYPFSSIASPTNGKSFLILWDYKINQSLNNI